MFPVVTTTSLLLEAILPVQTVYYRRKFWKYKTWRTVVVFFTSLRTITHPSFPLQDFLKFFLKCLHCHRTQNKTRPLSWGSYQTPCRSTRLCHSLAACSMAPTVPAGQSIHCHEDCAQLQAAAPPQSQQS